MYYGSRRHPNPPMVQSSSRHSPAMAGIDRTTGKMVSGWPHVVNSINALVTTSLQSRVMRRDVGSDLSRLVDAPISPNTIIDFYAASAIAIDRWEPRFRVERMGLDAAAPGTIAIFADGTYYPRGHLGDFSVSEKRRAEVVL